MDQNKDHCYRESVNFYPAPKLFKAFLDQVKGWVKSILHHCADSGILVGPFEDFVAKPGPPRHIKDRFIIQFVLVSNCMKTVNTSHYRII